MSTTNTNSSVSTLKVLRRSDYALPPYTTKTVNLSVDIFEDITKITGVLHIESSSTYPASSASVPPLVLFRGKEEVQTITGITVDGKELSSTDYTTDEKTISLPVPADKDSFSVFINVDVFPKKNTSLEGLYFSDNTFTTQCEAEGFRNIIPYQDRPDIMAIFTVKITADKTKFPVLLSNGNETESSIDISNDRHSVTWIDPHPKPSYLFALVAGDLAYIEDKFTTMNKRDVRLRIYTVSKDIDKTAWAMESLKKSMKWDEDSFGLEYDLAVLNVFSTPYFNMGAMENKGLLIFNSRLILSSSDTATDVDYGRIEGVIGHEYFHNWTGNRVTCRDWFQLTLKEGLTVYRDQEFSSDMNSRAVKRIEDVLRLRLAQFAEDASPTSHAIRPDEVIKQDNFYTATVYEKGAEIIRLYATMLGTEGFRKGMDLYFQLHDNHAVTCDDFWAAMRDANTDHPGVQYLPSLLRWYSQAGTPELTIEPVYDATNQTLTLKCNQRTPPTAGQKDKVPVLIPIAVGLVGKDGKDLPLLLNDNRIPPHTTQYVLPLVKDSEEFVFTNVPAGTVPSLLRNFSAPVRLNIVGQTDSDLAFLLAHDSDSFNRWESGQRLGRNALISLYDTALAAVQGSTTGDSSAIVQAALEKTDVLSAIVKAFTLILADTSLDGSFAARALTLPAESEIVDVLCASSLHGFADPVIVHQVREYAVVTIARSLRTQFETAIANADKVINDAEKASGGKYSPDFQSVARRAIRNKCLAYLSVLQDETITNDIMHRYTTATNMTDSVAALGCLIDLPFTHAVRKNALDSFAAKWKEEPLVLLKWLQLQACASSVDNTAIVENLTTHASFSFTNPNACYSLFGAYASASTPAFHAIDGSGYKFLARMVLTIDGLNPQVAARIVNPLSRAKSYDKVRCSLMRQQLEELSKKKLSENVGEIVTRALAV